MSVLIRDARKGDVNFLLDSWLKSWRKSKFSGVVGNDRYFETTRAVIENLVARGAKFKVACLESDEDSILGWINYEKLKSGEDCVHYLYVKDPYLKMGVADRLVELVADTGFYTFRFNQVVEFFPRYKWVPEIARRKE
jgi:hypothetical protein